MCYRISIKSHVIERSAAISRANGNLQVSIYSKQLFPRLVGYLSKICYRNKAKTIEILRKQDLADLWPFYPHRCLFCKVCTTIPEPSHWMFTLQFSLNARRHASCTIGQCQTLFGIFPCYLIIGTSGPRKFSCMQMQVCADSQLRRDIDMHAKFS